jgi:hypothetical protein
MPRGGTDEPPLEAGADPSTAADATITTGSAAAASPDNEGTTEALLSLLKYTSEVSVEALSQMILKRPLSNTVKFEK